ncbi:hypothetical protein MLD38_006677 [Melastoma candidum]|uniref:Uncharacterized protein n=1 Tax=Melastoma candidum TaxID=119954 RepID=A0ACB9RSU8_9MYRT|nr:hypothetical protein MLD38_006677 [Melastoma candidum]
MAFDQNSIPKDLRPLNVAPSIAEESSVAAPATTAGRTAEGFYATSAPEGSSPPSSVPVFYSAAVSDPGFGGLGYVNGPQGVAAWFPRAAVPYGHMSMNPAVGFGYNPNLGGVVGGNAFDLTGYMSDRMGVIGGNAIDQMGGVNAVGMNSAVSFVNRDHGSSDERVAGDAVPMQKSNLSNQGSGSGIIQSSEDGGEDSVSGKKIKFLCSFGGKILPRPSDGMLRYVGGQTRIISVRKDVSLNDLVAKMVEIYGQPVIIKYQLPDEDLDALVSVSCPDDLDNMMEEHEKLSERTLDGSAKLRVFLFSASELDSTDMVQFGDLNNSGHRYVEAVNGMADSIGLPGIARKESMASATSTQNSEFSGNEPLDTTVPRQGDSGVPTSSSSLSPGSNLAPSNDAAKMFFVDPDPPSAEDNNSNAGFPVVNPSPLQTSSSRLEVEVAMPAPIPAPPRLSGYDLPPPVSGMGLPPATSFTPAYVDPRGENINLTNLPSPHLMGGAAPLFAPQQFHGMAPGLNPHHFVSPVHMTMVPAASHIGIRPPLVQPSHLEHERSSGPRVFLVPFDQSHNAYHLQASGPVVGGGYGWNQVVAPGPVVFSDGSTAHQQSNQSESIQKFEDCYMCQKALPHAHSDTVVQDQKDGTACTVPISASIYHSLRLDDNTKPQTLSRTVVTGATGIGFPEPPVTVQSILNGRGEMPTEDLEAMDRPSVQKAEHVESRKLAPGFAGNNEASLYGAYVDGVGKAPVENGGQQQFLRIQSRLTQDGAVSGLPNGDGAFVGGLPVPGTEQWLRESPKEYSKLPDIDSRSQYANSVNVAIDRRVETPQMTSSEMLSGANGLDVKLPVDESRMDEMFKQKQVQQNPRGEVLLNIPYVKPDMLPISSQMMPTDFASFPVSKPPGLHEYRPVESFNMVQPLNTDMPRSSSQTKMGVHPEPEELHCSNSGATAVGSGLMTESFPSAASWITDSPLFQPTTGANDEATLQVGGQCQGGFEDRSNSLFMNQDPWNLNQDAHFPPPKPTKIALRKEPLLGKDALLENRLRNVGDLNESSPVEDELHQPFNNFANVTTEQMHYTAEEKIKQDLQDVAEGVAASVLQSGLPSNPDMSVYQGNKPSFDANPERDTDDGAEMQTRAGHEDNDDKVSDRRNFGFPASGGIGRLQIIKNSDLEELRELGSGTYGTVYHGKWRGSDVAIKRINDRCFSGKPSEQDRMRNDFWNEAIKLADLHHPNVVAFYGVVLDGPGGSIATVTEYMVNGSLRTALQKNEKNLDKRKRLLIAMDVAFGMEYLHGKNIVHFDLKSDNLLVNLRDPHRPICKVGDLGLSKVKCQTLISGGVRGTLPWMAPELLNGSSSLVSEKVDVFSFGIVMWELLTGDEPYAELHYGAIIGGIVSNTLRPPVPDSCDPEWRSLMERCWSSEPSERPNFTEITDTLRSMASKIPTKAQNSS